MTTGTAEKTIELRNEQVAHGINAHLPAAYRDRLLEEAMRVADEVLRPRGLTSRHVLLVGGAGYIGSVLSRHLLDRGYPVTCLDHALYQNAAVVEPFRSHADYRFVPGDLVDGALVDAQLADITDVVILAALVGDPITKKYPDETRAINLEGTLALLERLSRRGLNRVVFISTCSNYGMIPDDRVADEAFELNPKSLYAETKVSVERALLSGAVDYDYQGTVLRFATAFGLSPRMRFDLTISEFVREVHLGRELLVYDPDTWRPYCHVQDFSEVIRRTLEAPQETVSSEVFNAGGAVNNLTKRNVVTLIEEVYPGANIRYQEDGGDPRNYRVDFGKIRERLHFEPSYTVPDGIAELSAALSRGDFADVDARPDFYHNRTITYP